MRTGISYEGELKNGQEHGYGKEIYQMDLLMRGNGNVDNIMARESILMQMELFIEERWKNGKKDGDGIETNSQECYIATYIEEVRISKKHIKPLSEVNKLEDYCHERGLGIYSNQSATCQIL